MPIIGELIAGGVPEHVRMNWEWEFCGFSSPGDRFQEPCSRGGTAPLGDEHISRFHILAAQLTEGPDFLATQPDARPRSVVLSWTRYDLQIDGTLYPKLYKRGLVLKVVRALVEQGVSVLKIQEVLPPRKFVGVPGKLAGNDFRTAVSEMQTPNGAAYDPRRYYFDDADLFFSDGKTWALSNQWSIKYIPDLDQLILEYPEAKISHSIAAQGPD
jgi:hypothetical protein